MSAKTSSENSAPVVLITGCSSGIGLSTAQRFARAGYRVFASMRDPARGAALRQQAEQQGWYLRTPPLDVTRDDSVTATVTGLLQETDGRLDVLVNNAGVLCIRSVEETTPDELRAQFETNVVGVLRTLRAVLPTMRARGQGVVVNVSSVLGRVIVPANGPYQTSKWALEALTETLRYEVRPFGIRVICVEPGPFKTQIRQNQMRAGQTQTADSPYAWLVEGYLQSSGRLRRGPPESVAEIIYRAATAAHPRLRWSAGTTAVIGGNLRRLIPDGFYELFVRWMMRRWGVRRS